MTLGVTTVAFIHSRNLNHPIFSRLTKTDVGTIREEAWKPCARKLRPIRQFVNGAPALLLYFLFLHCISVVEVLLRWSSLNPSAVVELLWGDESGIGCRLAALSFIVHWFCHWFIFAALLDWAASPSQPPKYVFKGGCWAATAMMTVVFPQPPDEKDTKPSPKSFVTNQYSWWLKSCTSCSLATAMGEASSLRHTIDG